MDSNSYRKVGGVGGGGGRTKMFYILKDKEKIGGAPGVQLDLPLALDSLSFNNLRKQQKNGRLRYSVGSSTV